jgi:DNA-binding CsgD family transcriptional regulator
LEPDKWQAFFDHLSRLTKLSSGALLTFGEDSVPAILASGGFALSPEVVRLYNDHYAYIDPFRSPALRNLPVALIRGEELVSNAQLIKMEFYDGFLMKNDMESMTLLSFIAKEGESNFMPMWRRAQDGPMDEESIRLLEALLPHAHTALRIRRKLEEWDARGQLAAIALDASSTAAFLVTAQGRVLHMNKSAAALVQKGDGLRLEGSLLCCAVRTENARLRLLIAGAASAGGDSPHLTPGGAMNCSRADAHPPLQVAVLPIPEHRRAVMTNRCALVFVGDAIASPKSRAAMLRAFYGLTPTESRLSDLLLQGLQVGEAAESMRITLATARFQLKRVLAKTGTHRQSELMRLMLSLPGQ